MRATRSLSVDWLGFLITCVAAAAAAPASAQPVANPDAYTTTAATALTVDENQGVLANDEADDDDDDLQAVLVTNASNGTLLLGADGGFFYLPGLGFVGDDSFTYRVDEDGALSNVATVTISVTPTVPVNTPPTAVADSYQVGAGQTLNVNPGNGVLANDTDPDGDPLTAVLSGNVSSGTLALQPNGSFSFTPAAGFVGNVTFTYEADDGAARSNVATVTISVTPLLPVNMPPAAVADSYQVNEGQTLNVNAANGVLANDSDPNNDTLTAVLTGGASSGTLALQPNGSFAYTPAAGFTGVATFAYQADDGALRSNNATVTITVVAVNDPPTAQPDSYSTAEDTALDVGGSGVLGNDSDPDGDALTARLVRNVANGVLQLNANGSFGYAPPANFNGTTTFTYRARDASLESDVTTVTITVTAVNDPPFVTNSPPTSATEGVTYRYTLAASDPDGTTPTVSAPTLPGWLSFTAPATISGTPGDGDVGTHNVTMSVTDGTAPAVSLPFQITVAGVDNAPVVAAIAEQTATENTAFALDLTPFVTDTDTAAGSLSYAATAGLPAGLTLSAAGQVSGTPAIGGSVGTHTVRFTVADAENTVPGEFRLVVLPAGRVDLAVAMSASPNPATLETPVAWTLTVTNRAPQVEALGASLEASFAGEVPFRFDAPTTAGCTLTSSGDRTNLVCTLGRLAGGASTSITLTGRGSLAGDVFGTARVAVAGGGALDETPGNDATTASLSLAQSISGAPAQRIDLPGAIAIAAGDFNADGFDDLAVATASAQGVVVLTNVADSANPGRRAFATPPQALGGEALAADVAVTDIDRDGDPDVVTAAGAGAPDRIFVNSGGVFTSTSLGNEAVDSRAVAAGDINGDGFVDLIFAAAGSSTVLLNSGSGTVFTSGAAIGPHDARDVLLVDLLGDTLPELVLANADGGAAVYRNTGGAFALETTLATGPTSAVSSGDFNADGRVDLVFGRETAPSPAAPSALVWLNTSGGNGPFFAADELGAAATTDLLVRDFNIDARADVLALNGSGARIFTNSGSANGSLALHPQQLAIPGARGVAAGKFSNDDRVDLAAAGDGISVFINDGDGNFGQPDSNPPVIQLRGSATVDIIIDTPYSDAGATATDPEDGDITSRIVVTNPVNTTLLGTYTVTYAVSDLSGNAAQAVTRTVNVLPQPAAEEGGGGGALGLELLAMLLLAALRRRAVRRPT
jgi:VCBS repeat-containing protein